MKDIHSLNFYFYKKAYEHYMYKTQWFNCPFLYSIGLTKIGGTPKMGRRGGGLPWSIKSGALQ